MAVLVSDQQNLPAGHRLVPLRLGQVGQVPTIAAGHLSSVRPRRWWPVSVACSRPAARSHTRTVPSPPLIAVARLR